MWRGDGRPYMLQYSQYGVAVGPQFGWAADGKCDREQFLIGGTAVGLNQASIDRWAPLGSQHPKPTSCSGLPSCRRAQGSTQRRWRLCAEAWLQVIRHRWMRSGSA
tara:strand:- start:357 stop:674 length:318 start_codon:yes stop_codon:yes gene_type:complete